MTNYISNSHMLSQLDAAFKRITTGSLEDSILTPEKFDRFIREVQNRSPIIREARFIRMMSHTTDIDRVSFTDRILHAPPSQGDLIEDTTTPDTSTNELVSAKAVGVTELTDEALEDNIEREGFEDTLVALIGERAGLDLEELFIQGDEESEDDFLALTDGWLLKAGGSIDETDFDPEDPESMFQTLLDAMPKKYLTAWPRGGWRYYTTFEAEDHYRDILRERGTELGDRAQTSDSPVSYKGIPVREVPNMPDGSTLLTHPNNTVWGAWREVRIERERQARHGRTDFVTSLRADCHYEDENAAMVATGYTGPGE